MQNTSKAQLGCARGSLGLSSHQVTRLWEEEKAVTDVEVKYSQEVAIVLGDE